MAGYGIEQNFDRPENTDSRAIGATKLDLILQSIDATLSAKVTPSGMDINADLSLRSGSTYSSLTDVKKLALKLQTADLTPGSHPVALWADADGDLWYNNNAGDAVQLSNGSSAAGPAGNIATTGSPAYGASSVALQWNAASGYHFYGDAGVDADIFTGGLRVVDGAYSVGLIAPTLATNVEITLPASLPASTSVLTITAAGLMQSTRDLSVDTIAAGGLISAAAGVTAAVDTHITVSGNGTFKHGARTICRPMMGGNGTGSATLSAPSVRVDAGDYWNLPLQLEVGWAVSSVNVYLDPSGTGMTISVVSVAEDGSTSVVATRTVASSTESDYAITGASFTVEADKAYYVQVLGANTGDKAHLVSLVYSQP